jgi:hypothetical protein
MKTAILLRAMLITVALGSGSAWAGQPAVSAASDAHAQASALLSRPASGGATVASVAVVPGVQAPVSEDGHAKAAGLLSRQQVIGSTEASAQVLSLSRERVVDGHTRAAALLSRQPTG